MINSTEALEEIENYFSEYIQEKTDMSFRDSRMLMQDVIDSFINNIPTYNNNLLKVNQELEEKLSKAKDFINDLMLQVSDIQDEVQ